MTSRVTLVKTGWRTVVLSFSRKLTIFDLILLDYPVVCRPLHDLMYLCRTLISLSDPVAILHRMCKTWDGCGKERSRSQTWEMVDIDGCSGLLYSLCLHLCHHSAAVDMSCPRMRGNNDEELISQVMVGATGRIKAVPLRLDHGVHQNTHSVTWDWCLNGVSAPPQSRGHPAQISTYSDRRRWLASSDQLSPMKITTNWHVTHS